MIHKTVTNIHIIAIIIGTSMLTTVFGYAFCVIIIPVVVHSAVVLLSLVFEFYYY